MDRLRQSCFVDIGKALSIGEQVNVEHEDCPAGVDNKRRLYIRRKDDEHILAYCHHCSQSGSYRIAYGTASSYSKGGSFSVSSGSRPIGILSKKYNGLLPTDFSTSQSDWPAYAKIWTGRYGITQTECTTNGIGYSKKLDRVILPVWRDTELAGFQTRQVNRLDDGPKYKTYGNPDYLYIPGFKKETLVIVEDVLSCIKCARYVSAMAILGNSISDRALQEIATTIIPSRCIVFMDDDNRDIKLKQLRIRNKLLNLCEDVTIVTNIGHDPKECDDKLLQEILL